MVAFRVDDITLLVHHVIILNEAFTNTEVILLHFLLRTLDRRRNHIMLNHLALLEAHLIHESSQTIRAEHTHQVIFHADIEHTATWVTLTTRTTTQLTVHTATLVAFGTDDSQTACILHLFGEFDIRTTTSHVGCDSHHARATCLSHHISLMLVQFRVQYIMFNLAQVEHTTQQLTDFHRSSTYQYRATCGYQLYDFLNYRIVFLAFGAVDAVVHILASDRAVGRNYHHI